MKTYTNMASTMFKSKSGIERSNQKFIILKAHKNQENKLFKKKLTKEEIFYQVAANNCLKYLIDKKREQKMEIKTFKKLRIFEANYYENQKSNID